MKEWVYIARSDPNDLHGDLPLLEESIAFVSWKWLTSGRAESRQAYVNRVP